MILLAPLLFIGSLGNSAAAVPCPPSGTPLAPANPAAAALSVCSRPLKDVLPAGIPAAQYACPSSPNLRLLDSRFPAGGIFVNFVPPIAIAKFPGNAPFIQQLVKEVAQAAPGTQVNVVVNQKEMVAAEKLIGASLGAANVRVIPVPSGVSMWAQDTHEFGVRAGKPAILDLPVEPERGADIPAMLANACTGSELQFIPEPPLKPLVREPVAECADAMMDLAGSGKSAKRGAKARKLAEAFPGCAKQAAALAGGGDFAELDCCPNAPSFSAADFGGNIEGYPGNVVGVGQGMDRGLKAYLRDQGNSLVEVRIRWLKVGHVDEMFNVVPTSAPAPCNFALLAASPRKGLELLGARPGDEKVGDAIVEHPPRNVNELLDDADFVEKNKVIQELIETDGAALAAEIRAKSNCPGMKVVEVPALFSRGEWKRSALKGVPAGPEGRQAREDSLLFTESESVLPNMVNGVVLNPAMLVPDPHYSPFKDEMAKILGEAGVQPRFLDDSMYHNGTGEIHCGTNVIRSCGR